MERDRIAENIAVYRESGENVTLECSSAGCPIFFEGYNGMYLLHDFKEREEVLFYSSNPGLPDKITPRARYKNRIQTNGTLKKHTVTISNLTVDDSGFYTCVYKNISIVGVDCNVYPLFVRGVAPCYSSDEVLVASAIEKTLPLELIIIPTCAISTVVTITFILLIVPRMKQWTSSRRRATRVLQVSNDNVYEVMSKNSVQPPVAPEQSPPSPFDFA